MLAAEDASDEPSVGRGTNQHLQISRETGTPSPSLPGLPSAVAAMSPLRDGALMAASAAVAAAAGSVPLPPLPQGSSVSFRDAAATQTSPIQSSSDLSHSFAGGSSTHHAPGSSQPLGAVLSSLQGARAASVNGVAATLAAGSQVLYGVGSGHQQPQPNSAWLDESQVGIDIARRVGGSAGTARPTVNNGTWGSHHAADDEPFGEPGGPSQELKATVRTRCRHSQSEGLPEETRKASFLPSFLTLSRGSLPLCASSGSCCRTERMQYMHFPPCTGARDHPGPPSSRQRA